MRINTSHVLFICLMLTSSVFAAQNGDVLSYFYTGDTQTWGLETRVYNNKIELYAVGTSGQVYKFAVDSVAAIKNGAMGVYDSKTLLMSANFSVTVHSLALNPSWEGSGWVFTGVSDNYSKYRSRWGIDIDGSNGLIWTLIGPAWQMWVSGDIAAQSRTDKGVGLWTTFDNGIYAWPKDPWTLAPQSPSFFVNKNLKSVALGGSNDLWLLTTDGEILDFNLQTGQIIKRFYLASSIVGPWGLAYDSVHNTLWVASTGGNIYQVEINLQQAAAVGWYIDTNNASAPLLFYHGQNRLYVAKGLGPVFDTPSGAIGPAQYTATVLNVCIDDYFTIMKCKATYGSFNATYTLKFREVPSSYTGDPNSMEMRVYADSNDSSNPLYVPASKFDPGIVQSGLNLKIFYCGQRGIDAFVGNFGDPAIIYWPEEQIYMYGSIDADFTNSTGWSISVNPKFNFALSNPPLSCFTMYDKLSSNSRPVLKDKYIIRISSNLWNTLGPISNRPSEYKDELKKMVFFDDWSGDFELGKFALNWLKNVVADKMNFYTIVESWQSGGFDDCNPDSYRIPDHNQPARQFGTKNQLLQYITSGKNAGRIGLRCNYMMATDNSWSIQEGSVKRALNSDGVPQWFTDFNSVEPLVSSQESDIHTDFNTTAVFHDQWTSGMPVNLDANWIGAERPISASREIVRSICQTAKQIHQGPMGSESLFVEDLLGQYVDTGDFGIMDGATRYDFVPEYKMRRLHQLSTFHGMGLGYRFFTGISNIESGNYTYFSDTDALDNYRACEILYGNGAYLFFYALDRYGLRHVHAITECFTVGVIQEYYALQPVDYVLYGKAGVWETFDSIIKSSNTISDVQSWFKQFHIRYKNGCHVWVNRDTSNLAVTLPDSNIVTLPQNGWLVYTEDCNVIAYTALSVASDPDPNKRVDFCEDKNRQIKYVNPRQASSYKGVNRPTVWFDGNVHFILTDPNETFVQAYLSEKSKGVPNVKIGDILSYFNTNEPEVWGIDCTGIADTVLHTMTSHGMVYAFDVTDNMDSSNGCEIICTSKTPIMAPTNIALRGIAVLPISEDSYLQAYYAVADNQSVYRSRWGIDGEPGNMVWGLINGAWTLFANGDITPASRGELGCDMWCTYGDSIYRYPSVPWTAQNSFTKHLVLSKPLKGVSLGDTHTLWVLCQDRQILNISDGDGSVITSFYLDPKISQPGGIAYDRKGSIWVTNKSDNKVYRISVVNGPFEADFNNDKVVNFLDYSIMTTRWKGQIYFDELFLFAQSWLNIKN